MTSSTTPSTSAPSPTPSDTGFPGRGVDGVTNGNSSSAAGKQSVKSQKSKASSIFSRPRAKSRGSHASTQPVDDASEKNEDDEDGEYKDAKEELDLEKQGGQTEELDEAAPRSSQSQSQPPPSLRQTIRRYTPPPSRLDEDGAGLTPSHRSLASAASISSTHVAQRGPSPTANQDDPSTRYPPWQDDPENPRNWSNKKKWILTLVVALSALNCTFGSSVFVPSYPDSGAQFGVPVTERQYQVLPVSTYVLGLGVGPFIWAPVSELWGRQPSYVFGMMPFIFWNVACGLSQSHPQLTIFRFLCGVFGSASPGLGNATISDLFVPSQRGRPLAIYAIGPTAGPVLGSMIGSYIRLLGWRWVFWIMTILSTVNTLSVILFMTETYDPVVKRKLAARRLKEEGREPPVRGFFEMGPEVKAVFTRTLTRPPRLLLNPIAAVFIIYYSYVYGVMYIFIVAIPLLWGRPDHSMSILFTYRWTRGTQALAYIPLGIGFMAATATTAIFQDRIYRTLSKRHGGGRPEFRLLLTQVGMFFFPVGLFVFAWTAETKQHWILPCIGSTLLGYGLMLSFVTINNWIVDNFYPYSAAASAAACFLRSVIGCILPIFAPTMFQKLGYGWGGSMLGFISAAVLPAPMILYRYGPYLRKRFSFEP